mmetsp:Transcript_5829/g.11727  ORF Transcript_5829/g.11727 Transcript_5829/m.11727 type:complete len:253 (+) Transcript_5829:68-826(+)
MPRVTMQRLTRCKASGADKSELSEVVSQPSSSWPRTSLPPSRRSARAGGPCNLPAPGSTSAHATRRWSAAHDCHRNSTKRRCEAPEHRASPRHTRRARYGPSTPCSRSSSALCREAHDRGRGSAREARHGCREPLRGHRAHGRHGRFGPSMLTSDSSPWRPPRCASKARCGSSAGSHGSARGSEHPAAFRRIGHRPVAHTEAFSSELDRSRDPALRGHAHRCAGTSSPTFRWSPPLSGACRNWRRAQKPSAG